MLRILAVMLLGTGLASAQPASDPDTDFAAREYQTAGQLYDRGQYEEAIAHFEAARKARPSPAFDYNLGRCHDRLGHWQRAIDEYESYLKQRPDAADAASVRERVGMLRARITASAQPTASPPPIESSRPPLLATTRGRAGIALGTVGAVLLVSAIGTGTEAMIDRNQYRSGCAAGPCDQALYDRAHSFGLATDVMIGVGAAAAVAAIILVATRPRAVRMSALRLEVSF